MLLDEGVDVDVIFSSPRILYGESLVKNTGRCENGKVTPGLDEGGAEITTGSQLSLIAIS